MTDDANGNWRDEIIDKIIALCSVENAAKACLYLALDEAKYNNDYTNAPSWKMLHSLRENDSVFKKEADDYADEQRRREMMHGDDVSVTIKYDLNESDYSLMQAADQKSTNGFVIVSNGVPDSAKLSLVTNRSLQTDTQKFVAYAEYVVHLGFATLQNIYRWYNGEICGKRAAKNIIDSCAGMACGIGGAELGAAVGSLVGPVGTIVGCVIGGTAGGLIGDKLMDILTQHLFDLPPNVALDHAYTYLGVTKSSSVAEINAAYRALCLQHHPDKNENCDKEAAAQAFHKLQAYMATIKIAHGEKY